MRTQEIFKNGGIGHSDTLDMLDQYGFEVRMKPSKFLAIAAPFTPKSDFYLRNKLRRGRTLGVPYLWFTVPDEWFDEDYSSPATCTGHEGRNRMYTVRSMYGDKAQPVCILFRNIDIEDVSLEMLSALRSQVLSQSSAGDHNLITGSNFRTNL